jgi:uncharacterized protein (TIGR00725 family)
MSRLPIVAVIGSGEASPEVAELTRELGRELGAADFHLVCGGRGGLMEAACRGHREGRSTDSKALTLGVLPGSTKDEANDAVDVVLPTGIGIARNAIVVSSADVVIAVSGGSGTLSEIALAWQFGKPIIALTPSGGWASELAGRRLDTKRDDAILEAESPSTALSRVRGVLGSEISHGR